MPERVEIRINERELRKFLRGKDMKAALTVLAQIAETSAKSHAPVDTGNLRRSITHEVEVGRLYAEARIGTNVRYAIFQELGTRHHPAQPFLRPALEAVREALARG